MSETTDDAASDEVHGRVSVYDVVAQCETTHCAAADAVCGPVAAADGAVESTGPATNLEVAKVANEYMKKKIKVTLQIFDATSLHVQRQWPAELEKDMKYIDVNKSGQWIRCNPCGNKLQMDRPFHLKKLDP